MNGVAVIPIRTYPDPVLAKPCRQVAGVDQKLCKLADDMAETMYQAPGIGLAAPQVGHGLCLVVVESQPREERGQPLFLFNPCLVSSQGSACIEEGCLSLPGFNAEVERAARVVVEALDREGRPVTITAEGLLAIALQHELDHLEGTLLVDHISPLKRALYRKHILKQIKKDSE